MCEEKTKDASVLELILYFQMKHLNIAKSREGVWNGVEGQPSERHGGALSAASAATEACAGLES